MSFHQPVLLKEAIDFLNVKSGEFYLDATCGGGGHSEAILKKGGKVLGLDCDQEAVDFSKKRLKKACPNASFKIIKNNFVNLKHICQLEKVSNLAGIIFDLGTSFHQLETPERGFSFSLNEDLDMRMDLSLRVTAKNLINGLGKKELYELFTRFGEEKLARPIVKAILWQRRKNPIKTTKELADIISYVYKKNKLRGKIHPATKIFQALRIIVNDELNNLKKALPQAINLLKGKGRLVVISFHSLEDKIVKDFLRRESEKGILKVLTSKPVIPTKEELEKNHRCRSAKLRAGEKYEI